jgi:hypothetical protein
MVATAKSTYTISGIAGWNQPDFLFKHAIAFVSESFDDVTPWNRAFVFTSTGDTPRGTILFTHYDNVRDFQNKMQGPEGVHFSGAVQNARP